MNNILNSIKSNSFLNNILDGISSFFNPWTSYDYIFIGAFLLLIILFLIAGFDKIIKMIIGAYILLIISWGISLCMSLLAMYISTGTIQFVDPASGAEAINFLDKAQVIIILIVFVALFLLILGRFNAKIFFINKKIYKILAMLLFVPLLVLLLFVDIGFVVYGPDIFDISSLRSIANSYNNTSATIAGFVMLIPIWILLPGIFILLFSWIYTKKKSGFAGISDKAKELSSIVNDTSKETPKNEGGTGPNPPS